MSNVTRINFNVPQHIISVGFTNVLVHTISSWSRPLYSLMFACMGSKFMLNSIWCHCTWLLSCVSFWCNFVQPLKKFPQLFATLNMIPIYPFLANFLTSFCFNLLKPNYCNGPCTIQISCTTTWNPKKHKPCWFFSLGTMEIQGLLDQDILPMNGAIEVELISV